MAPTISRRYPRRPRAGIFQFRAPPRLYTTIHRQCRVCSPGLMYCYRATSCRCSSGRTFGTPSLCCQEGRLVGSSASAKCSGSEMRARSDVSSCFKPVFSSNLRCRFPKPLYTPHLLLMLDLLDILCLLCVSREYGRAGRGSIHRSMIWFLQIAQLSTTISQAHRATAFH